MQSSLHPVRQVALTRFFSPGTRNQRFRGGKILRGAW